LPPIATNLQLPPPLPHHAPPRIRGVATTN
jgi:hypothetical protein